MKNDKNQVKIWVVEKKLGKNKKKHILSVQISQIPYILKTSIGKKLTKNSLKSDLS